jgi:hypothetical protein
MAFGREVHHGARLVLLEQRQHLGLVADIAAHESVARVVFSDARLFRLPA